MDEATTRAIELKEEKTNEAINEIEDLRKYAINFDLRLLEPLGKTAIFEKKQVNFDCGSILFQKVSN